MPCASHHHRLVLQLASLAWVLSDSSVRPCESGAPQAQARMSRTTTAAHPAVALVAPLGTAHLRPFRLGSGSAAPAAAAAVHRP